MYYVAYWYDWDGISCAPNGSFCFFKSPKKARERLLQLILEHAKYREYEIDTEDIFKKIKYENSDLFEISAEDLFNDENDYSKFKTAWVDSGEIVSIY